MQLNEIEHIKANMSTRRVNFASEVDTYCKFDSAIRNYIELNQMAKSGR